MSESRRDTARLPDQIVKRGLIAGLKATAAMILVMFALRFLFGVPSLTEIAADWFSAFLPGRVVDFLLETLSFSAKPLMFAGLLVLQIMSGFAENERVTWMK